MHSSSRSVAIVTGASRGLGAVISRLLAHRHYDLVLNAREEGPLQAASSSLRKGGGHVIPVAGDIADPFVQARLVDAARGLGGLRLLVNNASELGGIAPLTEVAAAQAARVMQVNAIAPIALATLALPLLSAQGGLIVNISSDAALGGYPGWGAYGASKAALELLTRTLANELAEGGAARASAISVDPGDMRTRMHQEAFPGEDISDRPLPQITLPFWEWLLDQAPASLNGQRFIAREVAAARIAARHDDAGHDAAHAVTPQPVAAQPVAAQQAVAQVVAKQDPTHDDRRYEPSDTLAARTDVSNGWLSEAEEGRWLQ